MGGGRGGCKRLNIETEYRDDKAFIIDDHISARSAFAREEEKDDDGKDEGDEKDGCEANKERKHALISCGSMNGGCWIHRKRATLPHEGTPRLWPDGG